jgi:hypothetical protein
MNSEMLGFILDGKAEIVIDSESDKLRFRESREREGGG